MYLSVLDALWIFIQQQIYPITEKCAQQPNIIFLVIAAKAFLYKVNYLEYLVTSVSFFEGDINKVKRQNRSLKKLNLKYFIM
jgi:hypothetical protein